MKREEVWKKLEEYQGKTFYTVKGLPFQYTIRGGELFVNRREKSITRATILKAFDRMHEAQGQISGPKQLNVFGAPYIWAIFKGIDLMGVPEDDQV